MAEKDYKKLYENALEKNRKLKSRAKKLYTLIEELREERLSCDVEPMKGELFGRTLNLVCIEGQPYVRAELWATYNENVEDSECPEHYTAFLRTDDDSHPIPSWCQDMDLAFVIARKNEPRFMLNPQKGHPLHIVISDDLWAWESWNEDYVSALQIEHDTYYLKKCAISASTFAPVENES